MNIPDDHILETSSGTRALSPALALHKWGGLASFLMPAALIAASFVYFTGNLRDALGPFTYAVADFLYGPVCAASLVTAVYALREYIGRRAPRRMSLALLAALLAAAALVSVALIRSANRNYHLSYPELHLENNSTVLIVWTTLVAGVSAAGWHFLGWAMLLVGWAGWSSSRLPRLLCGLYWAAGALLWFVYLLPEAGVPAGMLGVVASIWQGIILWRARPEEMQTPESNP